MLNFRPSLSLVLSALYIFSQVQAQDGQPPACAVECGTTAAASSGCNLYDTTCCSNPTFLQSATACVSTSCSASDANAAAAYFTTLCSGAGPSAPAASSALPSAPPSGSESPSGTDVVPSSAVSGSASSGVPTSGSAISSASRSVPTAPPGSSLPGSTSSRPTSAGSSSTSSRPSSSNAAATPTHVAALVAGGIGALFAVVV